MADIHTEEMQTLVEAGIPKTVAIVQDKVFCIPDYQLCMVRG